jgi:excisionase family DNA binding protein
MIDHEAAVRSAVDALAAAILAAVRAEGSADPNAPQRLLSVDDACAQLSIKRSALYGELGAGRLRSVKVGRRRLVPSGAVAAYIAERGA